MSLRRTVHCASWCLVMVAAFCPCLLHAGDLIVDSGGTIIIHSNVTMNAGTVEVRSGGQLDLAGGIISDAQDFGIEAGGGMSATGTIQVNRYWINESDFVMGPTLSLVFDVCSCTNHAIGNGDTDGDGVSDHGEGCFDATGNGVPDFMDLVTAAAVGFVPCDYLSAHGLPLDHSLDHIDTDGDGMTTWEEYHARTDARNPASVLKITDLTSVQASPIREAVEWQSVNGKSYLLRCTTNLQTTLVPFPTIVSNVTAVGGSTVVTSGAWTASEQVFFNVEVLP